jgi:hypothetical protein
LRTGQVGLGTGRWGGQKDGRHERLQQRKDQDQMRHRATLATAIVVVLLSGIVSAGAKTGVLSINRSATPATVALEMVGGTADGGGGQGQPARSGKGKGSKSQGSPSTAGGGLLGVDITVGGSAPADGGSGGAGVTGAVGVAGVDGTASVGGGGGSGAPVQAGASVSGPGSSTTSSTAPAAKIVVTGPSGPAFTATALGIPVLGDILQ